MPVVLDLIDYPDESQLRWAFTRLVQAGILIRVRNASPEVALALRLLKAQVLMRHAERANPRLFSPRQVTAPR